MTGPGDTRTTRKMDATPAEIPAETPIRSGFFQPAEVHVFRLSPLGVLATSLILFVLVYGFYVLVAETTNGPGLFEFSETGQALLTRVAWIAFVLSLIFTAGIAFSETGRRLWEMEADDLSRALGETGRHAALDLQKGIPDAWRGRYLTAFLIGALAGLGFNALTGSLPTELALLTKADYFVLSGTHSHCDMHCDTDDRRKCNLWFPATGAL